MTQNCFFFCVRFCIIASLIPFKFEQCSHTHFTHCHCCSVRFLSLYVNLQPHQLLSFPPAACTRGSDSHGVSTPPLTTDTSLFQSDPLNPEYWTLMWTQTEWSPKCQLSLKSLQTSLCSHRKLAGTRMSTWALMLTVLWNLHQIVYVRSKGPCRHGKDNQGLKYRVAGCYFVQV